jgi:hypothetical protein
MVTLDPGAHRDRLGNAALRAAFFRPSALKAVSAVDVRDNSSVNSEPATLLQRGLKSAPCVLATDRTVHELEQIDTSEDQDPESMCMPHHALVNFLTPTLESGVSAKRIHDEQAGELIRTRTTLRAVVVYLIHVPQRDAAIDAFGLGERGICSGRRAHDEVLDMLLLAGNGR